MECFEKITFQPIGLPAETGFYEHLEQMQSLVKVLWSFSAPVIYFVFGQSEKDTFKYEDAEAVLMFRKSFEKEICGFQILFLGMT